MQKWQQNQQAEYQYKTYPAQFIEVTVERNEFFTHNINLEKIG